MPKSKISQDDMNKYKYLFGYRLKQNEIAERNQKILVEINEAKRASKHIKSSNLEEFKVAKVIQSHRIINTHIKV